MDTSTFREEVISTAGDSVLQILQGDCRDTLKTLPDASVQACVTSPPYFGLRAYLPADHPDKWREIGQEKTPQEFVQTLVGVFSEVRRVLRDDGVLFVNLADSYAAQRSGTHQPAETLAGDKGGKTITGENVNRGRIDGYNPTRNAAAIGLKHKDLCLVPQRFVIAMQDAGWYVRDQIAWVKRAPMPESVKDRFTKAWEPIFMFTKSARYYFDIDAVKEPATAPENTQRINGATALQTAAYLGHAPTNLGRCGTNDGMRQMRNAWILSPEPTPDAHFATYPTEIPRRCILAGSRAGDVVLDPFGGSGTTAKVAIELGRKAVTCELNPEYVKLIERRTTTTIGFAFD